MSGHWEEDGPVRVTSWSRASVLHDFSGFPPALFRMDYPAPGRPDLTERILKLLSSAGIPAQAETSRPLDHGVWVPLRFLYPAADVPVIEVSQPVPRSARALMRMGRCLAPLRAEEVLLAGTGGLVHNLRQVRFDRRDVPVDPWARAFEDWILERLRSRDADGLEAYRRDAPFAALAAPTPEHFDPLFFAIGASDERDRAETIYEGFEYGNLSMRTIAWSAGD